MILITQCYQRRLKVTRCVTEEATKEMTKEASKEVSNFIEVTSSNCPSVRCAAIRVCVCVCVCHRVVYKSSGRYKLWTYAAGHCSPLLVPCCWSVLLASVVDRLDFV